MSPSETKDGALSHEAKLRRELVDHGRFVSIERRRADDNMPTLDQFCDRWISEYAEANNRPKELQNKRTTMRIHLFPFFGKKKLDAIKTEDVDRYKRAKVASGLNPKTINNQLQILHRCLATANEWGLLETVPKMKQLKVPEAPFQYLTKEEAERLLSVIPDGMHKVMFTLAIRTGMRFSEFSALRWEDIDFERNEITVCRSIVEGNVGSTKNNRIRRIPMTADLRQILEAMPRTEGLLFEMNGKPVLYKTAYDWLRRYREEARVPSITMHQLRHSFASQLVALGAPLLSVRQLMGHADIKMTMRYAHLGPNELQAAVNLLEPQK